MAWLVDASDPFLDEKYHVRGLAGKHVPPFLDYQSRRSTLCRCGIHVGSWSIVGQGFR